ncbi:hypothetical protein D3C76_132130 [compost metagenome]
MTILLGFIIMVAGFYGISSIVKKSQKRSEDTLKKNRILSWLEEEKGFSNETLGRLQAMNLQQMQLVIMQQNLLNEQELQHMIHDPYLNQGLDVVVDRYYHGMDNGLDSQNHYNNDNDDSNNTHGSGGFNGF